MSNHSKGSKSKEKQNKTQKMSESEDNNNNSNQENSEDDEELPDAPPPSLSTPTNEPSQSVINKLDENQKLSSKVDTVVLPGDIVGKLVDLKVRLGPGLIQNGDNIIATKCGILRNPQTKYFWIENSQKRVSK